MKDTKLVGAFGSHRYEQKTLAIAVATGTAALD